MARIIFVCCYLVYVGKFFIPKEIRKTLDQTIYIGRENGNDIRIEDRSISGRHGKIFVENGIFSSHLDYEDTSRNGTTVLHWNGFEAKSEFVHKARTKIKPGDWIMILINGKNGMILIPKVI